MTIQKEMTRKEVETMAYEISDKILNGDFRYIVQYYHHDGTMMLIHHAFLAEKGDYYIIFSEHHAPIVAHKGDIEDIEQIEPSYSCKPIRKMNGKWAKKVRKEHDAYMKKKEEQLKN